MTIHRLIQNLAFNQDDIERLAAAYEEALLALHISDRDDPINKVIAQRIIEGARAGGRDPIALCKMAVTYVILPLIPQAHLDRRKTPTRHRSGSYSRVFRLEET